MSACPSSARMLTAFVLPRFSTEAELVRGMIDDDPDAWSAFRTRYDRIVLRCITKITRSFAFVTESDIQDIRSTFYLGLVESNKRRLRSFDPRRGNRLSTWIGLLAIHATRDWLRALRRVPPLATLAEALEVESDAPGPFEIVSQHERARLALASLDDLTARDRRFSELYLAGVPALGIAAEMEIDLHTVYTKKHKLACRLGALLLGPRARPQSSSSALRGRGRPSSSRR